MRVEATMEFYLTDLSDATLAHFQAFYASATRMGAREVRIRIKLWWNVPLVDALRWCELLRALKGPTLKTILWWDNTLAGLVVWTAGVNREICETCRVLTTHDAERGSAPFFRAAFTLIAPMALTDAERASALPFNAAVGWVGSVTILGPEQLRRWYWSPPT